MSNESDTEMNSWFQIFGVSDNDVISDQEHSHRISKLRKTLYHVVKHCHDTLRSQFVYINTDKWFDGIECEVLKANGKGWQKGRVKLNVVLEFVPDPEEVTQPGVLGFSEERSPLDDIRAMDASNNG
jgi:hypothetical protein